MTQKNSAPPLKLVSDKPVGQSLTLFAFERIREDILTCRLKPGERLRINALAEHYAVGATAVREALSRLVTEGLVESQEQRGFCVMPVSSEELRDLTQTRVTIECHALAMAIEHGDVDWESWILATFHKLSRFSLPKSNKSSADWTSAHRQFHEALLAGCNSPCTLSLCSLLYDKSERYRNLSAQQKSKPRDTHKEHQQLMDATLNRNTSKACKLLADHFWETWHIVAPSLAS